MMDFAFGPFIEDTAQIMVRYDDTELRAITDWVGRTIGALVASTRRIASLEES